MNTTTNTTMPSKRLQFTIQYDDSEVPSLESFLRGIPEKVIATEKPKIAITWLHTNEDHAPIVAHELYRNHPTLAAHINYICGNPHTAKHAPEKGFTYDDLNRSFSTETLNNPKSYEHHRAVEVIKFVKDARYILDMHNTVCTNFGKVMIIKEDYFHKPRIQEIIAASPLKRILLVSEDVGDLTLIGEEKARAVTLEYELGLSHSEAVPDAIQTIKALLHGNEHHRPFEREIFRMVGSIPKTDDPGLETKNFEPFTGKDGQTHYAVFLGTGPRSYREDPTKDYCGFYATIERTVI